MQLVGGYSLWGRRRETGGRRSSRGGVRCRGEGESASAGERERMGGRKEGKGKKKGGGRVGGSAGQLGLFKNEISNVWHSATLELFFFLNKNLEKYILITL